MAPHLEEFIISEINRGNGLDIPIRGVTQIHRKNGKFVAEFDPLSFNIEELRALDTKIDTRFLIQHPKQ